MTEYDINDILDDENTEQNSRNSSGDYKKSTESVQSQTIETEENKTKKLSIFSVTAQTGHHNRNMNERKTTRTEKRSASRSVDSGEKSKAKQRRLLSRPKKILIGIGSVIVAGIIALAIFISISLQGIPDVNDSSLFTYSAKSIVYAADGETILAEFQLENRDPIDSLEDASPYVVKGTVDTEDIRFYSHIGVDPIAIGRAVINNLMGGSLEGASTITQQLVRNTALSDEMSLLSIQRKIREAYLAICLENRYSKNEILLMYLNTINYGDGCYGIETAAQHYFQKSAKDLTIEEAATLIGIPQSPEYLNPIYNPEACLERRNTVLARMLSNGTITNEEYNEAIASELTLNVAETDNEDENYIDYMANAGIKKYPYFVAYLRDILLDEYPAATVYGGGLKIYTTLDVKTQEAAEEACSLQYERMGSDYEAALVAVDPDTGNILAMIGGKDYNENQFNIAAQKGRPTGSTFKAFTLVAALEAGISPNTYVDCTSPMYTLEDGTRIENFSNTNYGQKTMQQAMAVSSNTGMVRIEEEVGIDVVIQTARKLGIKDADLPRVSTLTLGVADVTPLEMAIAYATIANGGTYHAPNAITKIVNRNGATIYEKTDYDGIRVISEEIAGEATDVLKTVFTSGTATSARLANGRPVAGKTGTGENYLDHTLVGYTPSLCCATWIGDRSNEHSSPSLSCNTLFKNFMDTALEGTEIEQFPEHGTPEYNYVLSDNFSNGDKAAAEEAAQKAAEEAAEAERKAQEEQEAANKNANTNTNENSNTPVEPSPSTDPNTNSNISSENSNTEEHNPHMRIQNPGGI